MQLVENTNFAPKLFKLTICVAGEIPKIEKLVEKTAEKVHTHYENGFSTDF